jgi:hypothetical protein
MKRILLHKMFAITSFCLIAAGCATPAALPTLFNPRGEPPRMTRSSIQNTRPTSEFMARTYVLRGEVSTVLRSLAGIRSAVVFTRGNSAFVAIDQRPQAVPNNAITESEAPNPPFKPGSANHPSHPIIGRKVTVMNPLLLHRELQPNGKSEFARQHTMGQDVSKLLYDEVAANIRSRVPLISEVYVASGPTIVNQFRSIELRHKAGLPLDTEGLDDVIRRTWHGIPARPNPQPSHNLSQRRPGHP